MRLKDDIKQVPHWWPTNITRHSTKFGDLVDLANEIYTPLLCKLILSCILRNQKTGEGGDTHDKCK